MKQSLVLLLLLAACPPPRQQATGPGGNAPVGINPDACGQLDTTPLGKKLYAFLVASDELDRTTAELMTTITDACRKMAVDLDVPSDGDTRDVCNRAASELQADLARAVSSVSMRTTPPVCQTDVSLATSFAAQCEGAAQGSVKGTCEGGTQGNACNGYTSVDASAECKSSAEVHATTHTTCTPGRIDLVTDASTVLDPVKLDRARAAINDGGPQLLAAAAKLQLAGKAAIAWAQTGQELSQSAGDFAADLGDKAVCVAGQVAGVVAAASAIQARFDVSIQVSASFSATAGG